MLLLLLGVAFLSSVVVYFFSECRLLLLMITETTVFLPFSLCHTSNLYISSLYNKKLPGMPKLETEYAQNRVLVQDIKGSRKIYTHHSKSKEVKFPTNLHVCFWQPKCWCCSAGDFNCEEMRGTSKKVLRTRFSYCEKWGIQIKHKTLPLIPGRVSQSASKLTPNWLRHLHFIIKSALKAVSIKIPRRHIIRVRVIIKII